MRHQTLFALVCLSLLALAACSSTTGANTSPTATPAALTATSAASMTVYTSPDHTYQISYPTSWQQQTAEGDPEKITFTGPNDQYFEVSDMAGVPGGSLADLINAYCNAVGVTPVTVQTTTVRLARQTWTKGDCGAGATSSSDLIVEVVIYKGAVYQIDYSSSQASFHGDMVTYYLPMEQSFQFLT